MSAPTLPAWMEAAEASVTLVVHAQPGARKSEVVGPHGDALKIRIDAPPVDGKANEALLEFVARQLGVPRRAASLIAGETSRRKRLRIVGVEAAAALARLVPR